MPWLRFPHRILERLPLALFLLALAIGLIAFGIVMERYGLFPVSILDDAAKTARTTAENLQAQDVGEFLYWSDTLPADIPAQRITAHYNGEGGAPTPFLILGGRHQFRDLCPEHGCLAVAVAPDGEIVHAWPFRPNTIIAANIADEANYPYELNNFSIERDLYPFGLDQYANGDLLVTFHQHHSYPYGGGVARIDREGNPRWFRRDYSHHLPHLADGGIAFVPSYTIGGDTLEVPYGDDVLTYRCDGRTLRSALNVLDGDGSLLRHIPVFDILLASPWRGALTEEPRPCNPLHLNSIDLVGEDASGAVEPGDIVLSFRNISAFAILDGVTHAPKRLVRGSFFRQHDVTHLGGSAFLMFDNRGGDRIGSPSRLLMVDLAANDERTIFPTPHTPDASRLSSRSQGAIDISPDRQRAIVVFSRNGVALEVRLTDGEILATYRSLHDVSALGQFPDVRLSRAASFAVLNMHYVHPGWPQTAAR